MSAVSSKMLNISPHILQVWTFIILQSQEAASEQICSYRVGLLLLLSLLLSELLAPLLPYLKPVNQPQFSHSGYWLTKTDWVRGSAAMTHSPLCTDMLLL